MPKQEKIPFNIQRLDPYGQGVSFETDKTHFIGKVLPGEKGEVTLSKKSKGVYFSSMSNKEGLSSISPDREDSPCPFYDECNGCHYLHTSYEKELEFKKENFHFQWKKHFPKSDCPITMVKSSNRHHYRNRIQLHYDLKLNSFGFKKPLKDEVVSIDKCLLAKDSLNKKLSEILSSGWQSLCIDQPEKGTIELYEFQNEIQVSVNKPYAHQGFTQVHQEMNELLKSEIQKQCESLETNRIVDLFGGNGNLSEELSFEHRFVIDNNLHNLPSDTKTTYLSENLYSESTYDFGKLGQVDGIILDPPRSGFPHLKKWIDTLKPKWVLYVSCDYHKSLRDLKELGEQVKEIKILDFFPSTYHLETMFKLKFYS